MHLIAVKCSSSIIVWDKNQPKKWKINYSHHTKTLIKYSLSCFSIMLSNSEWPCFLLRELSSSRCPFTANTERRFRSSGLPDKDSLPSLTAVIAVFRNSRKISFLKLKGKLLSSFSSPACTEPSKPDFIVWLKQNFGQRKWKSKYYLEKVSFGVLCSGHKAGSDWRSSVQKKLQRVFMIKHLDPQEYIYVNTQRCNKVGSTDPSPGHLWLAEA